MSATIMLAKFDWVAVADTAPLQEQLREIFETRTIDAIAPSYGRPIVGASVVQRHYELMQRALAELGEANIGAADAHT